jgi:hypothetical protein
MAIPLWKFLADLMKKLKLALYFMGFCGVGRLFRAAFKNYM